MKKKCSAEANNVPVQLRLVTSASPASVHGTAQTAEIKGQMEKE